jgi:hypothetical protein
MSCNTTFGYNSLVGNCFTTAPATPAVPAAPFDSVQFNDAGNFGGDSSFTFDANTTTLNVPRIIANDVGIGTVTPAYRLDVSGSAKFTTIRDTANSVGTAGQLLSSTGAALQWVAAPTTLPAAPVNSVQFNNAGAFGGDSDFTFDSSTNALDVNGSAKFTTIRDTANSVGTAGQLLSSTGSALQWVAAPPTVTPAAPVNSVQFNNAGAFGGDSDFTFDTSTNTLSIPDITLSNYITHTGDSNTRIGFPANDEFALRTGGTDRLTITNTQTRSSNDIVISSLNGIVINPGSNAGCCTIERAGVITNNVQGFFPYTSNISGASGGGCQISMNNTSIVCSTFPSTTSVGDPVTLTERMRLNATGLGIATPTPAYPLDVNGSAKFTTIRDSANSVGTSGQVLSSTGTALSWIAAGLPCSVVRETKTANTNSAVTWTAGTTGVIAKRQFNVVANSGMSVTVSGTPNWTFTIPTAGTYFFEARATIRTPTSDGQTVYGKLVLNNNTLGLGSVIIGDSHTLGAINSSILQNTNWTHHLSGFYTITGSTVFTLDHIIKSQYFAPIGGLASNLLGYDEVYSVVTITKIA